MDVPVLLAILGFAGVLIGVLAGSRGQKLLDKRNNRHEGNPSHGRVIACPLDGGGREQLVTLANEMNGVRDELKGIRSGQGKVLAALGGLAADIGIIKDRGQRA